MAKKSIKTDPIDPVVPLEIPVGTEDPVDVGITGVGLYFNSIRNQHRTGIAQIDGTIKWGSTGIVWDVDETQKK